MKRLVQPEILDTLAPEDPAAIRSRRDLRRLNWWMGNQRIMRRQLRAHLPGQRPGPLVEIGAGDGNFLLSVCRKLTPPWPGASAILLDRQKSVAPGVLDGLSTLGWRAQTVLADVFDFPKLREPAAAIVANLFLHHFEDDALARLLGKMAARTNLFIALEPWRFAQPWLCGQSTRLIGCGSVTVHDAAASVRAGFQHGELTALWPDQERWQLTDRRAGLFNHLFVARRIQ